jgi:glutamate dehydrogenase
VGGFMIYRLQKHKDGIRELYRKVQMSEQGLQESWISTDEFYKTFDSLPFTVQTDLFIPAGGRPETIAAYNVANFLDKQGKPSAKVIIEGANSFITPEARLVLQQQGVVIMRDASANKCGVISSSYEILGNLMLSDAEFLEHKAAYVADVLAILNRLAEQEARLIIKRHREAGGLIPYTDFTNVISRQINEHYARMFAYFQANPQKLQEAAYRHVILQNMTQLIQTDFPERIDRLPEKIKYAVLAVKLASSLVYENDDNTMYGDLIEAQVRRLDLTKVA